MSNLSSTQAKNLALLQRIAGDGREVSEYEWQKAGGGSAPVRQLIAKGYVEVRTGEFVMPAGPYAGHVFRNRAFYRLSEQCELGPSGS